MTTYSPARLAAIAGSKAQTLRGQLRAILSHATAQRASRRGPWLLAPVPHRETRGPLATSVAERALREAIGRAQRDTTAITPALVTSADAAARIAAQTTVQAGVLRGLDPARYVPAQRTYGATVVRHAGYVAGERHVKHEAEWRHGRARTAQRAEHHVTVRSVGVARGYVLDYDTAGHTGRALAPVDCRWEWRDGRIGLARVARASGLTREWRAVHAEDIARGLYDARRPVWMPAALAEEFGPVEFGPVAEARAEIRRKLGIVRARAQQARIAGRDVRAVRLLARLLARPVVVVDARAVGHCMPGITAWAAARGLDLAGAVPCATLARDDDARARAVALHVARGVWLARSRAQRAAA